MSLKHLLVGGVLSLMVLFGVVAPLAAQDENSETLTIAFIGREASRDAALDRQLYQAAVTAADRINSGADDDEAGIDGSDGTRYDFEIVYYPADTLEDVTDALEEALDDGAIAILGPHDQDLAEALEDAGTSGLAVLLGASDAVSSGNQYRLTASPTDRATAAADYLVNERHFTRIAVLAADTEEALDAAEVFKAAVSSDVIVMDVVREADEDDFSGDAQTLRDEDAEALFVWALDAQTIDLLSELRENGWAGEIIYGGLDADFVDAAGLDLTAGIYGTVNWSSTAYDAASQTFVNAYVAQWDITPPDAAASYYDAVILLADAVAESGEDADSIRAALTNSENLIGAQGAYDGVSINTVRLVQVQTDGTLIEVARYAEAVCQTCPDTWLADSNDTEVTSTQTIRVGLIAALEGVAENTGENIEQAARMALREINDAGGMIGADGVRYTFDLVTYPANTAEETSAALQQAQTDGVQFLIGPDSNAQTIPNLFRAEGETTVQLVSATTDQATASPLYQLRPADAVLAEATATYLLDVRDLTRFASVAVRTDYGLDGAESFNDVVAASDEGTVVLELEHDVDQADLSILVDQIVSANVEAVALWTTGPAAHTLVNELSARGWNGVVAYGYLTPDWMSEQTDTSLEIVGAVNWWAGAGDWVSRDFTARYQTRYGEAPIPQAAAYYDALYLLARGLETSGVDGVQSWLADLETFIGVQGTYRPATFTTGELTRSAVILGVNGTNVVEYSRYENATCVVGCGN